MAGWLMLEPISTMSVSLAKGRRDPMRKGPYFASKSRLFLPNCRGDGDAASENLSRRWAVEDWTSSASPYRILGLDPASCSQPQLKAAFRARVKEFHPDVYKGTQNSDAIIRRVIQAYQILSKLHKDESTEKACLDPFEEPECEPYDLFINEVLCVVKGCSYSCVKRAPHAFSFAYENGTARAISQGASTDTMYFVKAGHGDDYLVQLAVPTRCIHYVTPPQRVILEDLLESVLNDPYDLGDAALLDSLISKARFENNRFQRPKRQTKVSSEYVDWC